MYFYYNTTVLYSKLHQMYVWSCSIVQCAWMFVLLSATCVRIRDGYTQFIHTIHVRTYICKALNLAATIRTVHSTESVALHNEPAAVSGTRVGTYLTALIHGHCQSPCAPVAYTGTADDSCCSSKGPRAPDTGRCIQRGLCGREQTLHHTRTQPTCFNTLLYVQNWVIIYNYSRGVLWLYDSPICTYVRAHVTYSAIQSI